MNGEKIVISAPKQVLVEGRNDKEFVTVFAERRALSELQVHAYGGIDRLRTFLQGFCVDPAFRNNVRSLAILRDADFNSATSAFDSVCNSVKYAGLVAPVEMGIFSNASPRIGVYIVPDCLRDGMLETLCFDTICHSLPQAATTVDNYLASMQGIGIDAPSREFLPKARLRAFLSCQNLSEALIGYASRANVWDWNAPTLDRLYTFLAAL
jgi:hypothetical protein